MTSDHAAFVWRHVFVYLRKAARPFITIIVAFFLLLCASLSLHAQTIGNLLWEENFDSLDTELWNVIEGDGCDIGLCGWGNQELENYRANNVSIEATPNESGNSALVFEARNENFGDQSFTSGKVDSENKVTIHYGMIETRIRVPNVEGGLWPAFWMLGTSTATWPAKGELDLMEMGHSDESIASHGHPGAPQNNFVGANAIFYSDAACVVGNETCAASTAWQTDNAYVSTTPMNDRFMIYRMYWTDTQIRFTAIDNGVEYDMYDEPIPITEESLEFQQPFYFLMNMAVGGTFTGLLSPQQISATLPGKMYIDYIRVYELDGLGSVTLGNPTVPETGTFGVFTDLSATNNQLEPGLSSDIYVWNTASVAEGTTEAFEGDNVIAWEYNNPGNWFGGGIQTRQVRDMSNFANGELSFWIKIPANISFRIGITDAFTNQNWVVFPANETTYGLVRNGEWGQASIPVNDLRGELVAIQALEYLFAIVSVDGAFPSENFQFAIDDVLWTGGEGATNNDNDGDGIDDESDRCPNTPQSSNVDGFGCPIVNQALCSANCVTLNNTDTAISYTGNWGLSSNRNGKGDYQNDVHYTTTNGDSATIAFSGTAISVLMPRFWHYGEFEVYLDGASQGVYSAYANNGEPYAAQTATYAVNGLDNGQHTLELVKTSGNYLQIDAVQISQPVISGDNIVQLIKRNSPNFSIDGQDGGGNGQDVYLSFTDENDVNQQWYEIDRGDGFYTYQKVDTDFCIDGNNGGGIRQNVYLWTCAENQQNQHWRKVDMGSGYFRLEKRNAPAFSIDGNNGGADEQSIYLWNSQDNNFNQHWYVNYLNDVAPLDSDGDGVEDSVDLCPNTPSGTAVDSDGCEIVTDSDGDGIADAIDQCPNTPSGSAVGADGCPINNDPQLLTGSAEASTNLQDASLAQDGNMVTRWESIHGVDPSWLTIDLGTSYNLSHVEIFWEAANAASYLVQGSNDNSNWTVLASYSGGTFGNRTDTMTVSGIYRFVRMYGISRSSGNLWGYSIYEMNAYGFPATTTPGAQDTDGDGVQDSEDQCPQTPAGTIVDNSGCPVEIPGEIVPLFDENTALEPAIRFDRGDALVTRIADRVRDRHAREDEYQAYDHFLTFYWENRTATIEIVDYVAKGGDSIDMTMITQWPLQTTDNRWWYYGVNTVAEYYDNGGMIQTGTNTYFKSSNTNPREGGPIEIGQKMEFEPSQFLQAAGLPRGRSNYYGTTYLYIVGEGLVPWDTEDTGFVQGGPRHQEDSIALPQHTWMGGETTLPYNHSNEPDNHFMQMATNLGAINGQAFVLGRRVHHSSFVDGTHDENINNGVFDDSVGLAGTHYINDSCAACHVRNGRAELADIGEPLDKWVFKIGDASGNPDPARGSVLQPQHAGSTNSGEGAVSISSWSELGNGLREPTYTFSSGTPARFSARIAPNIYGAGLLESIPEAAILALEDPDDTDGDGISGKASRVIDPATGEIRLGRFGYKAATFSIEHQVSSALNRDIGVMTPLLPDPDCGPIQASCGASGAEISQQHIDHLVKYVALLGVRPQRAYDEPDVVLGEQLFTTIGCDSCHTPTFDTSEFSTLAELRSQGIRPYSDLLLHDMGEGLADNLGEGNASGAEWRTAPLWGIGLSACVTGGVINPTGSQGDDVCAPSANFLHDGRARTIDEAIRWHGGEGQQANDAYQALSSANQQALVRFVESL